MDGKIYNIYITPKKTSAAILVSDEIDLGQRILPEINRDLL